MHLLFLLQSLSDLRNLVGDLLHSLSILEEPVNSLFIVAHLIDSLLMLLLLGVVILVSLLLQVLNLLLEDIGPFLEVHDLGLIKKF
jgi:hypothetical protein